MSMSEPLMPGSQPDRSTKPTTEDLDLARDLDLETVADEQGDQDVITTSTDTPQDNADTPQDDADDAVAAHADPPFITPQAGDSLSPEELRRES